MVLTCRKASIRSSAARRNPDAPIAMEGPA
jgi:hypothetical protein